MEDDSDIEETVVSNAVARMGVKRQRLITDDDVTTASRTRSKITDAMVIYKFMHPGGTSSNAPGASGNYQGIFLGSPQPFDISTITIEHGEHAGRLAFVIDPRPDPNKVFRLLELLPEIRRKIFKMVLIHGEKYRLSSWRGGIGRCVTATHCKQKAHVNLLRVSKEVRKETMPIMLMYNDFDFANTRTAEQFLKCIGPSGIQHLRHITFRFTWFKESGRTVMAMLANAHNLKQISLSEYIFWVGGTIRASQKRIKSFVGTLIQYIKANRSTAKTFFRLANLLYVTPSDLPVPLLDGDRISDWYSLQHEVLLQIRARYFEDTVSITGEDGESIWAPMVASKLPYAATRQRRACRNTPQPPTIEVASDVETEGEMETEDDSDSSYEE